MTPQKRAVELVDTLGSVFETMAEAKLTIVWPNPSHMATVVSVAAHNFPEYHFGESKVQNVLSCTMGLLMAQQDPTTISLLGGRVFLTVCYYGSEHYKQICRALVPEYVEKARQRLALRITRMLEGADGERLLALFEAGKTESKRHKLQQLSSGIAELDCTEDEVLAAVRLERATMVLKS